MSTHLLTHLASSMILIQKVKHIHWNIKGPHFLAEHHFLDDVYDDLQKDNDDLAERIISLGHPVLGSLHHFLHHSHNTVYYTL